MGKRPWGLAVAALLIGGAAMQGGTQEVPTFPFVIPWDDASATFVDVSALNPTPAGGSGFVTVKNGHFVDGKLRRQRFLGVNIVAAGCFPDKEIAAKVAARMHKVGINIVRMHHMDAEWTHPNLLDASATDSQHLDLDALDRLDYFIGELKKNGIYVNLNLHVSRTWRPGDGLPDTDKLAYGGKPANYFFPRMVQLQKDYAKALLGHTNPYTGTRYADEPAVAVVEITNENTLLGEAWGGGIEKLPAPYKTELTRQWNVWLKQKYATTDGLKRAWSANDKPLGPNRLVNADFSQGAERWNLELNTAPANAKMLLPDDLRAPAGVAGRPIRLHIATLGGQNWHIQFHQTGLDLTEGEPYTVSFWAKADRERPVSVYTSLDKDDWHNVGLNSAVSLTTEWKLYALSFTATRTLKEHNRLTFVLGDALGTIDLAGMQLRPGAETPFPQGATVEAGNFPLGRPAATPQGEDWINFLMETEAKFVGEMRDYLKKELGVKANIGASQANFGGLGGALRESKMDLVDAHAYWQHPEFRGRDWDPVNWRIPNTSLARDAGGGTLVELARVRVAGKPFTVSEYNHPAPNDYRAETLPMLVAFAAMQDWDGLYLFDYCSDREAYKSDKIKGFFSIDTDPAQMAFFPAAATLFYRNDMALANNELRLRIPEGNVAGQMAKYGPWSLGFWEAAGISRADGLTQRLSLSFAPGKKAETTAPKPPVKPEERINTPSANGPLRWEANGTEAPIFIADSPSSKVMVGFLGGRTAQSGSWTVQMADTPRKFAALMLTARDGKPVEQSKSLLLTAAGYVGNTGMQWNADRTSVGDKWGSGPTQAEGVPATITLRTGAKTAMVYALDGTGKRGEKVECKLSGGLLTFAIGPASRTLWYAVELS